MERFFLTLVRTGSIFGFLMFLYFAAVYDTVWPAVTGAVTSGVLFGLTMAVFGAYNAHNFRNHRPDLGPEQLLKEGPANHFYKGSSSGGWIYLTDTRLLFRSHWVNVNKHSLEIPLTEISEVEVSRSLLLNSKLHVHYRNGRIETFVVDDGRDWKQTIESGSRI